MYMSLRVLSHLHDLDNKTVLVRIDSDIDIHNGKIMDDTRLASSLETIHYILKNHGKIILLGHSGRPEGKINELYTLKLVASWFAKKFSGEIQEKDFNNFKGWEITPHLSLLENLRFYKDEEENNKEFAKNLMALGDVFVNEAFAVSHRNHASIYSLAKVLPSYAGFHLEREIKTLSEIMENPKRPLGVLIGGAKIETKLPVVSHMHAIAEYVMVGGKIADEHRLLMKTQHEEMKQKTSALLVSTNTPDGLSITDQDTQNFIQIINMCKTIVWNGPFGKMGDEAHEKNTLQIARAIIDSGAFSVVGGGDSLSLLAQHNLLSKFSFVSTGGGAMLEFLSGKKLPGIEAIEN